MNDLVLEKLWKGGTEMTASPHICPFRPEGMDQRGCAETSGSNVTRNRECCGTWRGSERFAPCTSQARRCKICVAIGRFGIKANAVVDVANGTCEEHASGAMEAPRGFRLSADPRTPRSPITLGTCAPQPAAKLVAQVAQAPPKPEIAPAVHNAPKQGEHPPPERIVDETLVESSSKNVLELNKRRLRILKLCSEGLSNAKIAEQVDTSCGSIEATLALIYKTIGVSDISDKKLKRATAGAIWKRYAETHGEMTTSPELETKPDDVVPVQSPYSEVSPLVPESPIHSDGATKPPEAPRVQEAAVPLELPTVEAEHLDDPVIDGTAVVTVDRVGLLDEKSLRMLRLRADGLSNGEIARKLKCKYGAVSSGMSFIYKTLGIAHIINIEEKQSAASELYRKHVARGVGRSVAQPSAPLVAAQMPGLKELERRLCEIVDAAEAALLLVGGMRKGISDP